MGSTPRRNRVDPWGDLHAVPQRGLFTGNRGCLLDEDGRLVRHHRGSLWITCLIEYRGWEHPLDAPRTWTPLFFLDDASAMAAGHRPCGLCRRDDYRAYRDGVTSSVGSETVVRAPEINRRLHGERLRAGRGLLRRPDRILWTADVDSLPPGTVVVDSSTAFLVRTSHLQAFTFNGWGRPIPRPSGSSVEVLTPPTSVAALAGGYRPILHPTASL